MTKWLAIVFGSAVSLAVLWYSTLPLGIPGEWTWERSAAEPDAFWNLCGGAVAASLFIGFILQGRRRFENESNAKRYPGELAIWLAGLVAFSFVWLWIVQEISPIKNRLGKSAFVLYYPSSSGYFTRARYDEPRTSALLAGYENLMREGDVLHTGTHPPGLFLVFQALIAACDASPQLSSVLDATQSSSFREACDVIASNAPRGSMPRQLLPLDRRVLWLATLLAMLSASLTVVPLYGLLRRSTSMANAWTAAVLWPATPAVAIFIPKSDAVFPLIGVTLLWLWLVAWDGRSLIRAFVTGLLTWCGLMCSLAFLPIVLLGGILTVGWALLCRIKPGGTTASNGSPPNSSSLIDVRRAMCLVVAGLGFAIPTWALWHYTQLNMLNVWWLNYRNHAGFYHQYARTYWKWLLVNPLELSFAAGWPISLLALVTCWQTLSRFRHRGDSIERTQFLSVVGGVLFVWGMLWLTGKNSGEAARLWILFLPWLIWLASFEIDSQMAAIPTTDGRQRTTIALLAIQFAVCLLTVARVNGFHMESG